MTQPDDFDFGGRAAALRAERREVALELRARGHSIRRVAQMIGASTFTVRNDLAGTDRAETGEEFMRSKFGSAPSAQQHGDPLAAPSRTKAPPLDDPNDWMRSKRDAQTNAPHVDLR